MKFTIRDLFLVTVIVAVCTAWVLDRVRLVAENDRLLDRLERIETGPIISGTSSEIIVTWPEPKPRGNRFFTRRELRHFQTLDSP
jgi:hypothetical protein